MPHGFHTFSCAFLEVWWLGRPSHTDSEWGFWFIFWSPFSKSYIFINLQIHKLLISQSIFLYHLPNWILQLNHESIIILMRFLFVLTLCIFSIASTLFDAHCPDPLPASNFTISQYSGLWYEIAKIQTAGGAFFERNCTCTQINVDTTSKPGSIFAIQSCIKNSKNVTINATLLPTNIQGKFVEQISVNKAGYWVIQLDENTAIEFDCQVSLGIRNYCIHVMSRNKTLDRQRLEQLVHYALSLGLNPQNLELTITNQSDCPTQSFTDNIKVE